MKVFSILITSSDLFVTSGSTIRHDTAFLCEVMYLDNFTSGSETTRRMAQL